MEIPNLLQAVIVELQTANHNISGIESGVSIISDDLTKIVKSIVPQSLFSSAASFDINLYDSGVSAKNPVAEPLTQSNLKASRLEAADKKNTQDIIKGNVTNTQDIVKNAITNTQDIVKSDVVNSQNTINIQDIVKSSQDIVKSNITNTQDIVKNAIVDTQDIVKSNIINTQDLFKSSQDIAKSSQDIVKSNTANTQKDIVNIQAFSKKAEMNIVGYNHQQERFFNIIEKSNINSQNILKSNVINVKDIVKSVPVEVLPKQKQFGDIAKVLDIKQNLLIPYLNGIKLSINRIAHTVENLFDSFVNSDMQSEEDRRELLDAIRSLKRKDNVLGKEDKKPSGLFGLLAISAATLAGTVVGFFEKILKILKLDSALIKIGKVFSNIEKFILESKLYAKIENMFIRVGAIFSNIEKFILESKLYAKIENIFLALERRFTTIGEILGKVFRPVINAIRNMPVSRFIGQITEIASSIFRVILRPLKMVMTVLGKTGGINTLGKWFALGKKFGTILGKLTAPIIVIMSIIDTAKAAFEGYKIGGIMGAIKGGISGLLNSLVGSLLDLVKDGVSWVAGKLGFENFSKMLDGFSFSRLITDGVDAIFGAVDYAIDWFKSIFSPEKFKSAFDNFGIAGIASTVIGGVFDTAKGAVSWLATMLGAFDIANALDNFSFGETINRGLESIWKVFSNAWDGIISTVGAITDWWKDWSFDGVFTGIKDFFFGIWDDVIDWLKGAGGDLLGMFGTASDFLNDFYRSILRTILPDRSKHAPYSPIGLVAGFIPDSVYEWAKAPATVKAISPSITPISSNNGSVLMQNPQPTNNTIVNNVYNNVTEGNTTNVSSTSMRQGSVPQINPFGYGSGYAQTF